MHLSKMPLSESHNEPWGVFSKEEDTQTLKRNVQLFKSEVQKQINNMTAQHAQEVKRLCQKIQDQARIIEAYESKYGQLNNLSPPKKQNIQIKTQTPSPKKPSSNLQNSQIINSMLESPDYRFKQSMISSPIKRVSHNSIELNMALGDQTFDAAPDELYKSRYEQRSRMKKQTEKDIYQTLKENKESVELKTQKLLEMVGERQPVPSEEDLAIDRKDIMVREKRVKEPDEELNTSLSFICDSLDRSKQKMKKKKSVKPQRKQINPEQEKKKQGKQRINYILRQMREKISLKEQSLKKQTIKTSKLLTTGHPGTSKVLINPVPLDLARKNIISRGEEQSPKIKNISTSILKNSSDRYSKTIDGLSAISKMTKQSSASRLFI